MFKKICAALLAFGTIMLCGCQNQSKTENPSGKLKIVTTIFPAYDFAKNVFGDTAEVTMLLKPGMESHSFDPSAKDVVKIDECDLFIYNGGESDEWVENILKSTENVKSLKMVDAVEVLGEEHTDGMTAEEHDEHEHDEEEYDEHVWTSPKNAALITASIRDKAKEISPENSSVYEKNAENYIAKIEDLDKRFAELLAGEKRYFVFGDRFPLLYFFKEYGLNYYAAFPGCASETEPSAQTISFLSKKLKETDAVKTVFYIELSNHKLADNLASESNLPTAEFHTCHNITSSDFEAGETYISLMERNYQTLKTALGK
ncbi:MAG: zinc ABC transporter substrate-binding protein [Oscillospiraceae bacterium]|nr:zinc ABC transporter substrate-binding protein [Oscillospiraceae bacterium]